MSDQTLTLKADGSAAFIATPMGLIKIFRFQDNPRKVRLELPPGLKGFHGEERAIEGSPYLEKVNGKLMPTFKILVPKRGQDGELIGLDTPQTFVLEG